MSWPSILLPHGPQAAAGFALINTFGAVGGFFGPYAIGLLADSNAGGTGGYSTAMMVLAVCLLTAGTAVILFPVPGAAPLLPKEVELASGDVPAPAATRPVAAAGVLASSAASGQLRAGARGPRLPTQKL